MKSRRVRTPKSGLYSERVTSHNPNPCTVIEGPRLSIEAHRRAEQWTARGGAVDAAGTAPPPPPPTAMATSGGTGELLSLS